MSQSGRGGPVTAVCDPCAHVGQPVRAQGPDGRGRGRRCIRGGVLEEGVSEVVYQRTVCQRWWETNLKNWLKK